MKSLATNILAVGIDLIFGEPPNALHPVAWFGRFVKALVNRAPRNHPRTELLYGAGIAASGVALAALCGVALERIFESRARNWLGVLAFAAIFKTTFAWRALIQAGESVRRDLESGETNGARSDLRALVSRDTNRLDAPLIAAAAIESLAENASDSFIAPFFYYHLFGLPGALAYRAINTMDAMIGYHGRYEFLGKIPARLDDVLNYVPARLTTLLLILAARISGSNARRTWETARSDHARTSSPNAGCPMSAMAGALNVRLEKVGHYRLNENGNQPQPDDIRRAAKIVSIALALGLVLSALIQIVNRDSRT